MESIELFQLILVFSEFNFGDFLSFFEIICCFDSILFLNIRSIVLYNIFDPIIASLFFNVSKSSSLSIKTFSCIRISPQSIRSLILIVVTPVNFSLFIKHQLIGAAPL